LWPTKYKKYSAKLFAWKRRKVLNNIKFLFGIKRVIFVTEVKRASNPSCQFNDLLKFSQNISSVNRHLNKAAQRRFDLRSAIYIYI
jgi:hypothetical protein